MGPSTASRPKPGYGLEMCCTVTGRAAATWTRALETLRSTRHRVQGCWICMTGDDRVVSMPTQVQKSRHPLPWLYSTTTGRANAAPASAYWQPIFCAALASWLMLLFWRSRRPVPAEFTEAPALHQRSRCVSGALSSFVLSTVNYTTNVIRYTLWGLPIMATLFSLGRLLQAAPSRLVLLGHTEEILFTGRATAASQNTSPASSWLMYV